MQGKHIKESIIKILNEGTFDDKTLEEVHKKLVKVDPSRVSRISDFFDKLEFKEHEKLANELFSLDQVGSIETVINHTIEEKDISKQIKFNLISLCHLKGIKLRGNVLNFLLHFKPESNQIIGKGEALFRIIMKGTPISPGDFGASGKKFEVKFNKSRLRGLNGFPNDASGVSVSLDQNFISECDSLGFDAKSLIGTKPERWNFVSGKRKKMYLFNEIVRQSEMNPFRACELFVDSFKIYFTSMTDLEAFDLSNSLAEEFHDKYGIDDKFGYSNFIYKMCAYSMKYYTNVEKFDGLLVIDDEFECIYITKEFIRSASLKELSAFIENNLQITPPNLTSKAGAQGSSFGISIL